MPLIMERVEQARNGTNDKVLCRMPSGWAVMGDVQFLPGYCLLLPDPVVASLNDLDADARAIYLLDMARIGDAVLQASGASRINYEILGNSEPELHCHIFPRYASEPDDKRKMPVWFMTGKMRCRTQKTCMGSCVRLSRNYWQADAFTLRCRSVLPARRPSGPVRLRRGFLANERPMRSPESAGYSLSDAATTPEPVALA